MVLLKSFISSSSIKINIVVIDYTVDHLYFSILKLDYYLLAINVIFKIITVILSGIIMARK